MVLLKPIFCATALIGIHFTSPYLPLLLDTKTSYETLITSFPIIYQDLSNVNTELMLQTEQRVINFIDDEKFKRSLPNNSLRESVSQCAIQYKRGKVSLLSWPLYFFDAIYVKLLKLLNI